MRVDSLALLPSGSRALFMIASSVARLSDIDIGKYYLSLILAFSVSKLDKVTSQLVRL